MTQEELIIEISNRERNGSIGLGTMNGWGEKTYEFFQEIRKYKIPNSESGHNLGRCWNASSFKISIDGKEYSVSYDVDSSD